jgi:hypothetical protein
MNRRSLSLLAAAALLLPAAPAFAANKTLPAQRLYRYYDNYLALPAAERSHFTVAYYLKQQDGAPLAAPVWMVDGARRTPIPLRADGKMLRLPTAAELANAKVEFGIDETAKIGLGVGPEPSAAPSADLDARDLALAVSQAASGMKKMAGIMALAVPKVQEVAFLGAGSGEVEFADGHRAPLPLVKGSPTYNPANQPNARRIHLARVPAKLDLN